jgi:hypothetical protein
MNSVFRMFLPAGFVTGFLNPPVNSPSFKYNSTKSLQIQQQHNNPIA